MKPDEEQIRELVTTWMAATKAGEVDTVLNLIADDVVFLVPGRPPMFKSGFAKAMKAQAGQGSPALDRLARSARTRSAVIANSVTQAAKPASSTQRPANLLHWRWRSPGSVTDASPYIQMRP